MNTIQNKITKNDFIRSPLNYTGGKWSLLSQLFPLFPHPSGSCENFYDLFCGGCSVGINSGMQRVFCSDLNAPLINMLNTIKRQDQAFSVNVKDLIDRFELSKINKNGYYNLREYHNSLPDLTEDKGVALFTLVAHSFNNQLRFNSKGEFNIPFGKKRSWFNLKMEHNLHCFTDSLRDVYFKCSDYQAVLDDLFKEGKMYKRKSFVYCDPPYLISTAAYNEQKGWTEEHEIKLLQYLDKCERNNIRFALSNVIEHNGQENRILKNWGKKYRVIELSKNYANCSYHKKKSNSHTQEILVVNYNYTKA